MPPEKATKDVENIAGMNRLFASWWTSGSRSARYTMPGTKGNELELIQSHMAQKPVLRGEVRARALRVRSVPKEETWASGVQSAWVGECGCEAD